MKKITFLCLLILFSIKINAQFNGGLDLTFNPVDNGGKGMSQWIDQGIAFQQDGKILIAGAPLYNKDRISKIARLNSDGLIDNTFNYTNTSNSDDINTISVQPDGKILVGGYFKINNISYTLLRLNPNGSLDTSFDASFFSTTNNVFYYFQSFTLQADGKNIVRFYYFENNVGIYKVVRLNIDGTIDSSFKIGTLDYFYHGGIVIQPDGKLILAGSFKSYNNVPVNNIIRLNTDGSFDPSFSSGDGPSHPIYSTDIRSVILNPNGKILIGGFFSSYNDNSANGIARLNSDGSFDSSFNLGFTSLSLFQYYVDRMVLQSDGKILISHKNSSPISKIVRINEDGSLDTSFNIGKGPSAGSPNYSYISGIHLQPNGKIIVNGIFTIFNNTVSSNLIRLNTDGAVDNDFNPGPNYGANDGVYLMVSQPDGKILIGGGFTAYNGIPRPHLARINTDGTLDTAFNPDLKDEYTDNYSESVESIKLQPDGKIILLLNLPTLFFDGLRSEILRLNSDGSRDTTFNTNMSDLDYVNNIMLQPDGKLIIGRSHYLSSLPVNFYISRLNSDGSKDATFNDNIKDKFQGFLLIQQNGKIIVKTKDNPNDQNFVLTRLNIDGSFDTTFNSGSGVDNQIMSAVVQPDGKIVLSGSFKNYNNVPVKNIIRLNVDGSIDTTFNSAVYCTDCSFSYYVDTMILLNNGKIFVSNRLSKVILNSDGSVDTSFTFAPFTYFNTDFYSVVMSGIYQPDGKLVLGGLFSRYNNTIRTNIVRIDLFKSSTNFELKVTDPTCQTKTNGKLNIKAIEPYNYTATMDGNEYTFTNNTLNIENLAPKTYSICIKVPDLNNRTQCFEFTVKAMPGLSGKTSIDTEENKTTASIIIESGTAPYIVEVNGKTVEITLENQFSVPVQNGDLLVVKTSVPCEGSISERISLLEALTAYPNPTSEYVELFIPNTFQKNYVKVQIIDNIGKVVINKEFKITANYIQIPMEQLSAGLYIIQLQLDKPQTIKVIKK